MHFIDGRALKVAPPELLFFCILDGREMLRVIELVRVGNTFCPTMVEECSVFRERRR